MYYTPENIVLPNLHSLIIFCLEKNIYVNLQMEGSNIRTLYQIFTHTHICI